MTRQESSSPVRPVRLTRRRVMQLGSLGLVGLSLPRLLAAESAGARQASRVKSCILYFMEGGPAHQDLWDMKPEAPVEYRGEFKPIPTTVPGVQVCEHLPMLARQMHHFAQVRSVRHNIIDHNAGAYYCLTGRRPDESRSPRMCPPRIGPSFSPSARISCYG